jgi:hypothetical protein
MPIPKTFAFIVRHLIAAIVRGSPASWQIAMRGIGIAEYVDRNARSRICYIAFLEVSGITENNLTTIGVASAFHWPMLTDVSFAGVTDDVRLVVSGHDG